MYYGKTYTNKEFYDEVVKNHIAHARWNGERIVHISVDIHLSTYDIIDLARAEGYNAKHIKNRIVRIIF